MTTLLATLFASILVGSTDAPQVAYPTDVVNAISADRLNDTIHKLESFGTRHTMSDTTSDTRGIGAARRWIKSEFERYATDSPRKGDLAPKVYFDTHLQKADGRRVRTDVDIVNVVMELPGSDEAVRDQRVYVIGHYDSRATSAMDATADAPGANDDGSGTAIVIELARVLSHHEFDCTIILMAVAGEEQGLYGARAHAQWAKENKIPIRAVLSNDIVGDPTSPFHPDRDMRVRVFSEGLPVMNLPGEEAPTTSRMIRWIEQHQRAGSLDESNSRQLARHIAAMSEAAPTDIPVMPLMVFRRDRFLRGGDHTPFHDYGYPAVRFSEVDENYDRQHQNVRSEDGVQYGDLAEYIDSEYVRGVAIVNALALVNIANAPEAPTDARIVTTGLSYDTLVRWDASDGDVAGYEIVTRATTEPNWSDAIDVGNVTEAKIPLNKDNYFFGVRAYDADGHRSPVIFPYIGRL